MIPKLLRARRRLRIICKNPIFLGVFCLIVFWVHQSNNEETDHSERLKEQLAEPAINDVGIENFKEIQNEIIQDIVVKPPKEVEQPVFKIPEAIVSPKSINNKYDLEIAADHKRIKNGLGADGKAARLFGSEQREAEEIMKKEAFNMLISDRISYNRTLPDVRDSLCAKLSYDRILPSASVIIIFTNEAWSPLIRTIWSVLNRSPAHHLKEILLIDDFSDRVELQGKLERYIETQLPSKVRLVRLKERQGLIRARLAGAKEATGDVIIFLDSHCEVIILILIFVIKTC